MATWYMYSFQNSNSPYADNLISFHNYTSMMLIMITSITLFLLYNILYNKFSNRFLLKNHNIEIIWTLLPMLILIFICFPSLKTLYLIDELWNPVFFTIKAIGHQWYWSYEYPDFNNFEFDSFMVKIYKLDNFRLLDVDNRMIVPYKIPMRFLTTSIDVIHSWTIPSMGIKLDATPGRINQGNIYPMRPGIFYGQCSEICGANHSFMPITMESTSLKLFFSWIKLMY
uniref:Cytochrome c oxidase subunit 2 n=1 Tax=Coelioxys fenestrata TaxID=621226 RepID=A0A7T4WNW7_9HYME|nr:cytochrome c oxidase subunit II [Coelioxys fenestrata]QQD78145.1 cytochrome c oxidase subunit 2 [Coelioxys fenestrata]